MLRRHSTTTSCLTWAVVWESCMRLFPILCRYRRLAFSQEEDRASGIPADSPPSGVAPSGQKEALRTLSTTAASSGASVLSGCPGSPGTSFSASWQVSPLPGNTLCQASSAGNAAIFPAKAENSSTEATHSQYVTVFLIKSTAFVPFKAFFYLLMKLCSKCRS